MIAVIFIPGKQALLPVGFTGEEMSPYLPEATMAGQVLRRAAQSLVVIYFQLILLCGH